MTHCGPRERRPKRSKVAQMVTKNCTWMSNIWQICKLFEPVIKFVKSPKFGKNTTDWFLAKGKSTMTLKSSPSGNRWPYPVTLYARFFAVDLRKPLTITSPLRKKLQKGMVRSLQRHSRKMQENAGTSMPLKPFSNVDTYCEECFLHTKIT